jgi:hypothetical protein
MIVNGIEKLSLREFHYASFFKTGTYTVTDTLFSNTWVTNEGIDS